MGESLSDCQVSVIVMTFNRPEPLKRCLKSLVAQTIGQNSFEVVLVDVSQPPVTSVVESFQHSLSIRHLTVENRGVAGNRNMGAQFAGGELLVYLDDDCVAEPQWLEAIFKTAKLHPGKMIGGTAKNLYPESLVACTGQLISEAVDATFNPEGSEPEFFAGLNFAVPKKDYLALGGCDTAYGLLAAEDRDFCRRWRESGRHLVKSTEAIVLHENRTTLKGFWWQYLNYGKGAYRFSKNGSSTKESSTVGKHLLLLRELQGRLLLAPSSQRAGLLLLLVVWEVANTTGFIWEAMREPLNKRNSL